MAHQNCYCFFEWRLLVRSVIEEEMLLPSETGHPLQVPFPFLMPLMEPICIIVMPFCLGNCYAHFLPLCLASLNEKFKIIMHAIILERKNSCKQQATEKPSNVHAIKKLSKILVAKKKLSKISSFIAKLRCRTLRCL